MRIKYIGGKPNKADNVAGTGLAWTPGQVHEVENPEACRKLLAHSGVWALESILSDGDKESAKDLGDFYRAEITAGLERQYADRNEAEEQRERDEAAKEFDRLAAEETAVAERAQAEADAAAAQPAAAPPAGLASAKAPGDMTLDELKAFCAAKSLKFHPNISRDKLLERLVAHAEGAQS